MKVGRKYYKGYCSKMRLTKNQLSLVVFIANNPDVKLSTLISEGFNESMVHCLVKKSAIWIARIEQTLNICELRLKGYKVPTPSNSLSA
jgi:hypothetical protein